MEASTESKSILQIQDRDSSFESAAKRRQGFLMGLCIVGAGITIFALLQIFKPQPDVADPAETSPLVKTVPVETRVGPIPVKGAGFVTPAVKIAVSAQVEGDVIYVSENLVTGGRFRKGDVLLKIDSRRYEANLARAKANLAAAEANLEFLKRQAQRAQSLSNKGFSSQEQLDQRQTEQARTTADIERLKAEVVQAEIDIEHAVIKAPFTGETQTENVDVGSVVRPGTELAQIYATDYYEIVVPLDPRQAQLLPPLWDRTQISAEPVKARVITSHGDIEFIWEAYVDRLEAGIDPDTRTIDIVIRVDRPLEPGRSIKLNDSAIFQIHRKDARPPLLIGAFVDVEIYGKAVDHQVLVPKTALRDRDKIWSVTEESRLKVHTVAPITELGDQIIVQALDLSDRTPVIVSDITIYADGMKIRQRTETQAEDETEKPNTSQKTAEKANGT